MTVEEACEILDEELGSGNDPIRWRGCDIDVCSLNFSSVADRDARSIRIGYYGRRGWVVRGTLPGMIRDRRAKTSAATAAIRRCPTCGQRRGDH